MVDAVVGGVEITGAEECAAVVEAAVQNLRQLEAAMGVLRQIFA